MYLFIIFSFFMRLRWEKIYHVFKFHILKKYIFKNLCEVLRMHEN